MTSAMLGGAALCLGIGVGAPLAVGFVAPAAAAAGGLATLPLDARGSLGAVTAIAAAFLVAVALLTLMRALLLRRRQVTAAPTWGCGYAEPTARMQYTAASFAEPVLEPFEVLFHQRTHAVGPDGTFPARAEHDHQLEDRAELGLRGAVGLLVRALGRLGFLQRGRVQLYLLYVLATLVALLVWRSLAGD